MVAQATAESDQDDGDPALTGGQPRKENRE